MFSKIFPKIVPLRDNVEKNIVAPDKEYGACVLYAGQPRSQAHNQNM